MSLQIGYIDNDGHPKIKIKVEGTNPGATITVEAMIDTGFTGFLMLPMALALPLGLILMGTGDYVLADGSPITNFLAKGTITVGESVGIMPKQGGMDIDSEKVEGAILLSGDSPLVGMEFLRGLKKMLIVGDVVVLIDISDFPLKVEGLKRFQPRPNFKLTHYPKSRSLRNGHPARPRVLHPFPLVSVSWS